MSAVAQPVGVGLMLVGMAIGGGVNPYLGMAISAIGGLLIWLSW